MLEKIQNRKESGFTIVEVMIVLGIAGLIILIVFLAVPALQRNARNTERTNDASLVGAAVNECLANRNGQVASCNEQSEIAAYVDTSKLRQLTDVQASTTAPATSPIDTDTINVAFARKCDAAGSAPTATGATPRSVALLFNTENAAGGAVTRCQEV